MSEEDVVIGDQQNSDEELDLELLNEEENQVVEEPEAEGSDDIETLKAKLEKETAEKNRLYARLKQSKEHKEEKPINSQPVEDSDWKRKIEFITTKGRNLDSQAIDEVIAYARGKGISYEDALETDVIKSFLRVKQVKEKIANATPHTSSKSTVINGKTFEEMSEEERAKNYTASLKSAVNAKKRA